ncbi:polysaccharide deacetylase family protein [Pseudofrankia saprophytica]|nr:polysaccharide deacetylase family protein [Pseudofrankia saprophytica]OHV37871.1 polysaccharide deacetylase [Pseudofrankia sp. EUN1h]
MFHSIGRGASPDFQRWQVDPGLFREQIDALAGAGYRLVGLSEALDGPDDRTVGVTFDDAYKDFVEAAGILRAAGCGATVYAPTRYVGGEAAWLPGPDAQLRIMDWSELAEVAAAGIEVGSHGHAHLEMDVLPAGRMRGDIALSRRILSDSLGLTIRSFCYPHGYNSAATRAAVRAAGFDSACEVGFGLHTRQGDRFAVRRLIVTNDTRPQDMETLVRHGQGIPDSPARRAARIPWRLYRAGRYYARTSGGRQVRASGR